MWSIAADYILLRIKEQIFGHSYVAGNLNLMKESSLEFEPTPTPHASLLVTSSAFLLLVLILHKSTNKERAAGEKIVYMRACIT